MKKTLLISGLILSLNGFSQSQDAFIKTIHKQTSQVNATQKTATIVNLKDSSYTWGWNPGINNWDAPNRTIYSYNTAYKENASISSGWTGSLWNNSSQTNNYIFDSNNNLLSNISQFWTGSAWQNNGKTTNTYDASNNQLTNLYQNWNSGTLAWENSYNIINTFDASNNILTSISQNWNNGTSAWVNAGKSTATYTTGNQYLTYMDQSWNSTTSSWANAGKVINIVYTTGDLTSYEYQNWNNATLSYESGYRGFITYDANHHILSSLDQNWLNTSSSWVNSGKSDFTYDGNGNQLTALYQSWNTTTNAWENSYREYDYYTSFTGLKDLAKNSSNINIYPNPLTNYMTVSSTNKELFNEINITDVTGKIVLSEKINPSTLTTLNLSSLTQGIYFMTLKGEAFTAYKKIVKN